MNRYFYMGVDASNWDAETLIFEAAELNRTGLFDVGYKTLLLGTDYEDKIPVMNKLANSCFVAGITLDATTADDAKIESLKELPSLRIVRLNGTDNIALLKAVTEKIKTTYNKVNVQVEATAENAKEIIAFADLLYYAPDAKRKIDYFSITRHLLDSCNEKDLSLELSDSVIRAGIMQDGKLYECLPMLLDYNYYKNQSIYFNYLILGTPLVLGTNPSELSEDTIDLLLDEDILAYAALSVPMGKIVHYYDPWHVLYGRNLGGNRYLMCILNRCHGDAAVNLLPDRDFDANLKPFSVYDLDEKRLLACACKHFEIYVETSDHPRTPSAKLLLVEEARY